MRALDLLRRRAGVSRGARLTLVKRIPMAAGLGGGSSDAAAALVLGNAFWQLGWSRQRLAELFDRIGPAFIMTHSMGGPSAWIAGDVRPALVKGMIGIEPHLGREVEGNGEAGGALA